MIKNAFKEMKRKSVMLISCDLCDLVVNVSIPDGKIYYQENSCVHISLKFQENDRNLYQIEICS